MLDRRTVSKLRIVMTRSKIIGSITALVAGALLMSSVARAQLVGVVTAVSKSTITVSGAVYDIAAGTRLVDVTEHPITLPELRPGVTVELEFDAEGELAVIRAAVVR
jgi:hypothetical protein